MIEEALMRYMLSLAVAALVGCASDTSEPPADRELIATMTSAGALSGTAEVRWTPGEELFTATAALSDDVAAAVRPWHVHFGSCTNTGDIVGPAESYEPLVVGQDGRAEMTATVMFELDADVAYSVNVHESPTALSTIIACGNLTALGGGGGGGGGGDDGGDDDYGY